MKSYFQMIAELATVTAELNNTNAILMNRLFGNDNKGTASLEKKAQRLTLQEEQLKTEVAKAEVELRATIRRAQAQLDDANKAEEADLDAFFTALKGKAKDKKVYKRDKAKDRQVAREFDTARYADKCIREYADNTEKSQHVAVAVNPSRRDEKAANEAMEHAMAVGAAKVAKKTHKQKLVRGFTMDEIKAEKARRRRDWPSTGSALKAAETLMGIPTSCKGMIAYRDQLQNDLEKINLEHDMALQAIEEFQEWMDDTMLAFHDVYELFEVMKSWVDEKEKLQAKADALAQEANAIFDQLKVSKKMVKQAYQNGNGVERALITYWESQLKIEKPKAKGISPIRKAAKVEKKDRTPSKKVLTFDFAAMYEPILDDLAIAKAWKPQFISGTDSLTEQSRAALKQAQDAMNRVFKAVGQITKNPIKLSRNKGVITRMNQTEITMTLGIDMEGDKPCAEMIVIDHRFEKNFSANWRVFSNDPNTALLTLEKIVRNCYRHLNILGVVLTGERKPDGTFEDSTSYKFVVASSSYQKDGKEAMANEKLLNEHEEFFYFGRTKEQFMAEFDIVGAVYLKAMANLARPINRKLRRKTGEVLTPWDILVMKAPFKRFVHRKALEIGDEYKTANGKVMPYRESEMLESLTELFAGQMMSMVELEGAGGQCSGYGLKGFMFDGASVIAEFCRKYGMTRSDFDNLVVEDCDGNRVRLGDYKVICTTDCWKFDKFFSNFADYIKVCRKLANKYPHVGELTILRQSEDEEGQWKRRHMTRSLNQQWMYATDDELNKLVGPTVYRLKNMMTMESTFRKAAGLDKAEEERSSYERLIEACPWIIMSPGFQAKWQWKFETMMTDAMANKLDAKGQYPYIIQDPMAMLEILVLGKSPDDPTIGVLQNGEISLEDVPEGKKVVALRFPANFLTAKVLKCRPFADVFASCGNIAILSIFDDVLIRQDGDTDGDEICILYNEIAISMTERMLNEFDPPVVLFSHGGKKAQKRSIKTEREFAIVLADALYSASHNDHTGRYANLARDCAYLAAIQYKIGNMDLFNKYILWMAAASTGAIISIDQVKGNDILPVLEKWLETISDEVRKTMARKQPYTQQFLKKDVTAKDCLGPNMKVLPDIIAVKIQQMVGKYAFDGQGICWNMEAATEALLTLPEKHYKVQNHRLSDPILDFLKNNVYNGKKFGEAEVDVSFKSKLRAHYKKDAAPSEYEVSLVELFDYLYHNAMALSMRMEGTMLSEQKEEFYKKAMHILREFVLTDSKPTTQKVGPRTDKEKETSLYVNLVNIAFDLTLETNTKKMTLAQAELCGYPVLEVLETTTNGKPIKVKVSTDPNGQRRDFAMHLLATRLMQVARMNDVPMSRFSVPGYVAPPVEDFEAEVDETNYEFAPDSEYFEYEDIEDPTVLDDGFCMSDEEGPATDYIPDETYSSEDDSFYCNLGSV